MMSRDADSANEDDGSPLVDVVVPTDGEDTSTLASNRSTGSTADDIQYRPGDHVYMWCESFGGIRYQHHGIVVGVSSCGTRLDVADFTAPDEATSALPSSLASNVTSVSRSSASSAVNDGTDEASDANEDGMAASSHGIRVVTCEAEEWYKEEYSDSDDASVEPDPNVVLERVNFLIQRPDLIPKYELLESNCECVAVWCRTGKFQTHQVARLFSNGRRNGALAAATGTAVAATVPVTVPAAGVWGWFGATATVSLLSVAPWIPAIGVAGVGVWSLLSHKHHKNWNERTRILNDAFDTYRLER
mmetsp:Transcript_34697/g.76224  ORF Transcript_34697/g.76224 Transcript_34697/m.76224 type:complete len:303 (+) Transcript_34697:132-1040(+)